MSIIHHIDKKTKTVYVTAKGDLAIEDLIEQEKKIIRNLDFEKGYNTYADFSQVRPSIDVDIEKIKMSVDFVKSIQKLR